MLFFNSDNILDFYIADTGAKKIEAGVALTGHRDSYFLSQPNGTWLESSETHLSHPNFKVYNHGGATGDIDSDGDMDVVFSDILGHQVGTYLWCLINDGKGFLKKHKCGGVWTHTLELADLDGDGYLDLILGGDAYDANHDFIGIIFTQCNLIICDNYFGFHCQKFFYRRFIVISYSRCCHLVGRVEYNPRANGINW